MQLNLIRPLVLIDLETTGINVTEDRIVQIAVLKIFPDAREDIRQYKINPTIPIPSSASKVHGIYDEDVQDSPTFSKIASSLLKYIDDSDIAGYNSNKFDIPLLMVEFSRCEIDFQLEGKSMIDVQTIFYKMQPRTLKAAYRFYCGKDLVGAHDAVNDIRATYEVLKSQLQHYENIGYEDDDGNISYPIQNNLNTLSTFTPINLLDPTNKVVYDERQREIFNFGKHQGKTVLKTFEEEPGYYDWMIKKDFSYFTKRAITKVWNSMNKKSDS
jgi:DNA polymerase-3 subunit epsilon